MSCRQAVHCTTNAVLILGSVVLVPASPGRAAADASAATEALAPGSWSVQFSVQPNFTLGSYAGSTLSAKRHLGSGNAVRFGVTVIGSNRSNDFADAGADTFSTINRTESGDGNAWAIGVGGSYLWYSQREAPVHVYGGAGPSVSWSRSHDQRTRVSTLTGSGPPPLSQTADEDITAHGWQVGVSGVLGVEWVVARRIGLIAEYGSTLSYTALESTSNNTVTSTASATRTDQAKQTSHRWDFSGAGGRLGVSAYF